MYSNKYLYDAGNTIRAQKKGLWTFVKGIKAFLIKQIELIPHGDNVSVFKYALKNKFMLQGILFEPKFKVMDFGKLNNKSFWLSK